MTVRAAIASLRWPFGADGDAERATRATATALYVGAVIVTGVVMLARSAPRTYPDPYLAAGLLIAALVLSFFKLRLPLGRGNSPMSIAQAADFVALMMVGPNLAMVIAAAGVLLQCTVRVKRRQPLHRTAFSVASVVVAVQAAGWVWQAFGGNVYELSVSTIAVPLSAAAMTYFAANTVLVAAAIALSTSASALREWYREFFWSAPA